MSEFAAGLLGKRLLISAKASSGYARTDVAREITVLEVSPSGTWVKVGDAVSGNKHWMKTSDIVVFETLADKMKRELPGDAS